MAASSMAHGSLYQFIDSVSEDFYCKQCGLVAREIVIASCCGESYCKGCIQAVKQDNKPCPGCAEESFEFMPQVKYQRKISALKICCSLKERGCGWSGPLASLDAHLHPDTGDCEYTDVDCPFKCGQKINKKTLERHTAKECVQRDYMCPYCAFKATYEIVTEIHWPECSYFPLACPNRCGVTCERPTMEDHMKICPLEEVVCQFEHVGCSGKFRREEEEQHMREKSQTHLVMMATACEQMKQDFQSKIQEQERKFEEQERKFEEKNEELEIEFEDKIAEQKEKVQQQQQKIKEQDQKIGDQERRIGEQERRIGEQEQRIGEQEQRIGEKERRIEEQERRFEEQEQKIKEQERKIEHQQQSFERQTKELVGNLQELLEGKLREMGTELNQLKTKTELEFSWCRLQPPYRFIMENFSKEKAKDKPRDWKSPPMYTHVCGYKFCSGIDANGYGYTRGNSVRVNVWCMPGEYDSQLKWHARAEFTIELVNHFKGGENKKAVGTISWNKPSGVDFLFSFTSDLHCPGRFIKHSELPTNHQQKTQFLIDDTLHFMISNVQVLN